MSAKGLKKVAGLKKKQTGDGVRLGSGAATASPSEKIAPRAAIAAAEARPGKVLKGKAVTGYDGPLVPKSAKTGRVLQSKESYKGHVFSVWTDTVLEPGATKPYTRDVIHHTGSVVVLALDERRSREDPDVILIRQYRHAAGQYLLELPAGRIDAGERPLAAAKREMIEETGYRAKSWTVLVRYFASPGFLGEWMQIYVAQNIAEGIATPEEDERIELVPTPLSQAMAMMAAGEFADGKTLIGLALLNQARMAGRL